MEDQRQMMNECRAVQCEEMHDKASILGALTLYLDFVNLFLFLLRFFGRRR